MPTTTFALFRNKDTGEQRIMQASGDSIALAIELAELAETAIVHGHLLVIWTTSKSFTRPAWQQAFVFFSLGQSAKGVEIENGGEGDEVYLIVGSPIEEGNLSLQAFRKQFASRLN